MRSHKPDCLVHVILQKHMKEQVLLFHFEDSDRLNAVRKAMLPTHIPCTVIDAAACDQPLGTFVGLPVAEMPEAPSAELTEEVLVLCGLSDAGIQLVLAALRKAGLYIPYKAMLTPTNKDWTVGQLFAELYEEHQAMMAMQKAKQQEQEK